MSWQSTPYTVPALATAVLATAAARYLCGNAITTQPDLNGFLAGDPVHRRVPVDGRQLAIVVRGDRRDG